MSSTRSLSHPFGTWRHGHPKHQFVPPAPVARARAQLERRRPQPRIAVIAANPAVSSACHSLVSA